MAADFSTDDIKDTVGDVVELLVDHPDDVRIKVMETPSQLIFIIDVHKDDIGIIIGTKGRTANALRQILSSICARLGKQANVEIPDKKHATDRNGTT